MSKNSKWITPFKKQCFVTLGVFLNMAGQGFNLGFPSMLLPSLRKPDSSIPIDDSSGSWIVAIMGFAVVAGNFIVPFVMGNYGRKNAHIMSTLLMIIGWFCINLASNISALLVARCLLGLAMGMSVSLGPVLVGEYTSPMNRGAFLMTVSLATGLGILSVHTMGSFISWQIVALICAIIAFVNLVIILFSPESPSFLADQGRYGKCREVFRWLRGDEEENEMQRMIETSTIVREAKEEINKSESFIKSIRRNLSYFRFTIRKKEFYKPILIMVHLYTIQQWCGGNLLASYVVDTLNIIVGKDANITLVIIGMGVQRIISNSCAVFAIRKVRRRTMILFTVWVNLIALATTALYVYAKTHNILPFDHPSIGIFLVNLHMFSMASGSVTLPFVIAGELFPLEYRSLAGGISVLFLSINLFITMKTVPFLFNTIGLHGAYTIYAVILGYCLLIVWKFLPETKDRPLQEIEDDFRGKPLSPEELKSAQSLLSLKYANRDRRCSVPAI